MVNRHRWPIYAYETLSTVIPRLCINGNPYTVVANVLFHCSDTIIDHNVDTSILHSMRQMFHDEYYKSLVTIYSNPFTAKNGCAEYVFSPLNTNIVQKVSPRIRNVPLKRLKSLLHESLYNFGLFNTTHKERVDINGLLRAVGLQDYFDVIDLLRLNHKLRTLTSNNVDAILDYHMGIGQNGRTKSIKFVMKLINANTNLDTLINRSNWSLERILYEVTKAECYVSFDTFINSLQYQRLLLQTREFLESTDKNTGLLRSIWGYCMRDFLLGKLKPPEPIKISKINSGINSITDNDMTDKNNCIKWDPYRNCFIIYLIDNCIAIRNRSFCYIDSIACLNESFDYLHKMCNTKRMHIVSKSGNLKSMKPDELLKITTKLSLNVEYSIKRTQKSTVVKPSLLSITVNAKDKIDTNDFKIYVIDLFNDDPLYIQSLHNLLDWILSSPFLIKLGHNIDEHIQYLVYHLESISTFSKLTNIYDIRTPRSLLIPEDKSTNNGLNPKIAEWSYETYSLNRMISSLLGINISTITNWDLRPLSQMNLQYATLRSCSVLDIDNLLIQNGWNYDTSSDELYNFLITHHGCKYPN